MKKISEAPITTSAASSQVPSQAQVQDALKVLYSELASSTAGNAKKQVRYQNERRPTNPTPRPPSCVGSHDGKNVPPPFVVVKGEQKPAPSPRDVNMNTRRVSSVKVPVRQGSTGTSEDVTKTPQKRQHPLPPVQVKPSEQEKVSTSEFRVAGKQPTKRPSVPVPIVTHQLVVPPIPQKKKQDGQVSMVKGKIVSTKPRKSSPMNRAMTPDKTSSRSPVRKTPGPLKAIAEPKATPVPGPKKSKEPGSEKTKESRPTPPTDLTPVKKKKRLHTAPEESKALKTQRARLRSVINRDVRSSQGTYQPWKGVPSCVFLLKVSSLSTF
ncbi:proteoglycan 4-like isoform X2 [Scomber scombrus]|uniref:Proteoglycan 4-like isoform X2 n=1 Tax=Scomber scombrus TaxID=13677 RepID=A0AAV1P5Z7_SCOSC